MFLGRLSMMLGALMHIRLSYKYILMKVMAAITIICYVPIVSAVTLNFSAVLTDATCLISLDKNVLSLGDVTQPQLKANQLLAAKPFKLNIQNCSSISGISSYSIRVSGNGATQDGKWLFKNSGTETNGAGIIVIQSNTLPDYTKTEIQDGTMLSVSEPGVTPLDHDITFYAGVSCGGSSGCAAVSPGAISATVMFDLVYR